MTWASYPYRGPDPARDEPPRLGELPGDILGNLVAEQLGTDVDAESFMGFVGKIGAALRQNPHMLVHDPDSVWTARAFTARFANGPAITAAIPNSTASDENLYQQLVNAAQHH